jgi:L-malate glycosyltransferase
MHVAFLTSEFPHAKVKHSAGIGTSIKNLVTALISNEVRVTIFVYAQEKREIIIESGLEIHLIENKSYPFGKWFFYRKYIQNYINKIVDQNNIQIIEAPDWTGITAFMRFKVPLVIRFHGSDTYFCYLEKRNQKLKNFWFEKIAVQNAQGYIAPTTFAGNLSAKLFGINPLDVKKIHYGLSLSQFQNENPDSYQNGLILYIGTIIRKKGVFELPSIFNKVRKQFPEAKLVLIGADASDVQTGVNSAWGLMQEQIFEDDKPFISYLGKIPYNEVKEHIQKANVCVFPTFAETLGMVTIESMAMQKAVVNSNIGWAQELIVDGVSGYLVNPSNHNEYAEKIIEILKNDSLAIYLGKNGRKRVEEIFNIDKIVVDNINFYNNLI